ncbi:MAG TPA: tRNA (cytidine(34)-2'-O)-methyltransferase [Gammaproteobacteria bacterium]
MFHILLYQPEIPPNTGNVIRLSANAGCTLHLIRPLGFELDEPRLKRAGLDYREWADVKVHDDFPAALAAVPGCVYAFTRNGARRHTDAVFKPDDGLLFGPETRGLPADILAGFAPDRQLHLPMRPENRSLNLSNAVAIAVYEAWRQNEFRGADISPKNPVDDRLP